MEKEDIIIGLIRENNEDTKEILKIIPTLQTKKDCEIIRKNNNEKRGKNLKYLITTIIALLGASGTVLGVISLIH